MYSLTLAFCSLRYARGCCSGRAIRRRRHHGEVAKKKEKKKKKKAPKKIEARKVAAGARRAHLPRVQRHRDLDRHAARRPPRRLRLSARDLASPGRDRQGVAGVRERDQPVGLVGAFARVDVHGSVAARARPGALEHARQARPSRRDPGRAASGARLQDRGLRRRQLHRRKYRPVAGLRRRHIEVAQHQGQLGGGGGLAARQRPRTFLPVFARLQSAAAVQQLEPEHVPQAGRPSTTCATSAATRTKC